MTRASFEIAHDSENDLFALEASSNKPQVSIIGNLIVESNDFNDLPRTSLLNQCLVSSQPAKLRQKYLFGSDLTDQIILSKKIKDSIWKITSSTGNIVLFDKKGIHRGGLEEEDERRVITTVVSWRPHMLRVNG